MRWMAVLGHAVAAQARHEVAQHVGVAVAAIAGEHHLQEHVLREQQPVAEARRRPAARWRAAISSSRRALHLLVGIEVVHADHVVLEEGAARGAGRLVVGVVEGRVHVAEHGVARGRRPPPRRCRGPRCPRRNQPGRWTISGRPVRAWARAAPRSDFSLVGREVRARRRSRRSGRCAAVPSTPSSASATISSAMASADMRGHLGRVRALQVVAGAHDDVEAGGAGDALQGRRVAADAAAGGIDHACAPPACGRPAAPRSPAARRRARNCARLTNGSCRSSPMMPDVHRLGGEMLALGLARRGATSSGSRSGCARAAA